LVQYARHRAECKGGARCVFDSTLRVVAKGWLAGRPPARQRDDDKHLRVHILPFLGDLAMPDVTQAVPKFVRHLERKETQRPGEEEHSRLASGTIQRVLATLRTLMNDSGYALRVPYKAELPAPSWIERPEDVRKFIDSCAPEWFKVAASIGVLAGLRKGESHTAASHLAQRIPLTSVVAILGHAAPQTTARYAHVNPASLAGDERAHLSFDASRVGKKRGGAVR
jgi:integrase